MSEVINGSRQSERPRCKVLGRLSVQMKYRIDLRGVPSCVNPVEKTVPKGMSGLSA